MAIDSSPRASTEDWSAVLGHVQRLDARPAPPYGVAVESALDDLEAAALRGRPLAPYLREAARAGCSSEQLLQALDAVRGSGAQAPPL